MADNTALRAMTPKEFEEFNSSEWVLCAHTLPPIAEVVETKGDHRLGHSNRSMDADALRLTRQPDKTALYGYLWKIPQGTVLQRNILYTPTYWRKIL